MRPHRPDRATGAEVCRLLGLDPDRVSSLGFELDAFGVTRVRVELLLEDELADRIAVALLSSATGDDETRPGNTTGARNGPIPGGGIGPFVASEQGFRGGR